MRKVAGQESIRIMERIMKITKRITYFLLGVLCCFFLLPPLVYGNELIYSQRVSTKEKVFLEKFEKPYLLGMKAKGYKISPELIEKSKGFFFIELPSVYQFRETLKKNSVRLWSFVYRRPIKLFPQHPGKKILLEYFFSNFCWTC